MSFVRITEATVRYTGLFGTVLLVAVLCSFGCASTSPVSDSSLPFVLHLDYRSGGDAPLRFALTFFENGRARLDSPRGKTFWATLDEADHGALTALRTSETFSSAVEHLKTSGPSFACCDAREVGIYESPAAQPAALRFNNFDAAPEALLDLVRISNKIGKKYFGRHYSLPMPER
jgi:hypothetical protein